MPTDLELAESESYGPPLHTPEIGSRITAALITDLTERKAAVCRRLEDGNIDNAHESLDRLNRQLAAARDRLAYYQAQHAARN